MTVFVVCEEGSLRTHWCELYLRGISLEAKRRGMEICEVQSDGSSIGSMYEADTAIVVGNSDSWIYSVSNLLAERSIRTVIVGASNRSHIREASYVLMDYEEAVFAMLDYLTSLGKTRIALFAVNSDSPADRIKKSAFLSYNDGQYAEKDVFPFFGSTLSACMAFSEHRKEYDAVISTNDVSAILLLQKLQTEGVHIPDELFITAFGDMTLGRSGTGLLTLALLDCTETGKRAVGVYQTIAEQKKFSSITNKLRCPIVAGDSTGGIPYKRTEENTFHPTYKKEPGFHDDPSVGLVMTAEKVLSRCDIIDLQILGSILKKEHYNSIAEKLHVSENTVKYRIKRLMSAAGLDSRESLISLLRVYLQ